MHPDPHQPHEPDASTGTSLQGPSSPPTKTLVVEVLCSSKGWERCQRHG